MRSVRLLVLALLILLGGTDPIWAADSAPVRMYTGSVLTTPRGATIKIDQDYVCYPVQEDAKILAHIRDLDGEIESLKSRSDLLQQHSELLKTKIGLLESMVAQRDTWILVEKDHAEKYRALLQDLLTANKSLQRRFPNLTKLVFGAVLLKEGVRRIP